MLCNVKYIFYFIKKCKNKLDMSQTEMINFDYSKKYILNRNSTLQKSVLIIMFVSCKSRFAKKGGRDIFGKTAMNCVFIWSK